jgi:hypothetical protein
MEKTLERETGIEPATNGLGSRYSTIELLPPCATPDFLCGESGPMHLMRLSLMKAAHAVAGDSL